jgi:hypothetical protein
MASRGIEGGGEAVIGGDERRKKVFDEEYPDILSQDGLPRVDVQESRLMDGGGGAAVKSGHHRDAGTGNARVIIRTILKYLNRIASVS